MKEVAQTIGYLKGVDWKRILAEISGNQYELCVNRSVLAYKFFLVRLIEEKEIKEWNEKIS